jgi:hypothetical protein
MDTYCFNFTGKWVSRIFQVFLEFHPGGEGKRGWNVELPRDLFALLIS